MSQVQKRDTEAKVMIMRLLQLNLNHCEAAQELLRQSVRELNVDIALISEPYSSVNSTTWLNDTTGTSAIWSVKNHMLQDKMGNECGFVRARVSGIYIYSCYIPPRYDIDVFKGIIEALTNDASGKSPILIAGDFNAWSTEWGCPTSNERGRILLESLALLDVVLLNSGNKQTFNRNGRGSIIDIAFASSTICNRITWGISNKYTHSDHSAIIMSISDPSPSAVTVSRHELAGWKVNTLDKDVFNLYMENVELRGSPEDMAKQLIHCTTDACNAAMNRRRNGVNKSPVYWWNNEIAELRKDCVRARRLFTRSRGRPENELHHQNLRIKKKALKSAIKKSKRTCFLSICDEVEETPFGLAYKLVTKKLKCLSAPIPTDAIDLHMIVNHLFPQHAPTSWVTRYSIGNLIFPEVTLSEVQVVVSGFENKKAPGPDGIPNVILKEIVNCCAGQLIRLFNTCLQKGVFPSIWKRQKLVLLPKDNKPLDEPSSYRPLCMIDTCGKLLEGIIYNRLSEHIEAADGLSDTQYGFRKRRSTIDAIKMVMQTAKQAIEGKVWRNGSKEYCVIVTLDVKNAFNTAGWEYIVTALRRLNCPDYLVEIIKDYFRDRVLIYDTNVGTKEYNITGGVPQGSVLGPLLWNVMYDGVLRLDLPERTQIIGFADDIALTVVAKNIGEAKTVAEAGIEVVRTWLSSVGLSLAEHKTEAVLVTSRKVVEYISLTVGNCEIRTKESLKYLGVVIDNRLSFKQHLEYVKMKAGKTCTALCRIMPNTRGPKYLRRKVLSGVVKNIILYASPIWAESTRTKTYCKMISPVYRLSAIRVCCAYRTVSDEAILVIAAMMPIDIQARRAKYLSELQNSSERENVEGSCIAEWQARWSTATRGRWTHMLIPNIDVWCNRKHGFLNFYLTQFLSGHGCFRSYLHRFGLDDSACCPYCIVYIEDPEHVFFVCPRFEPQRANLEQLVRSRVDMQNIVPLMLSSLDNWEYVGEFVKSVLLELRRQERIRRGIQ